MLASDILAAGAGATSPKAAHILAEEGPALLNEVLVNMAGIQFDSQPDGEPEYGKEAAHSRRRILHVGDGTGRAITDGLIAAMQRCPNITILSDMTAIDLIDPDSRTGYWSAARRPHHPGCGRLPGPGSCIVPQPG